MEAAGHTDADGTDKGKEKPKGVELSDSVVRRLGVGKVHTTNRVINSVAFSWCGKRAATASNDGTIRTFSSNTGECKTKHKFSYGAKCVTFQHDPFQVFFGFADPLRCHVNLFNTHEGKVMRKWDTLPSPLTAAAVSPVCETILAASELGVYKLDPREERHSGQLGGRGKVPRQAVAVGPLGLVAASLVRPTEIALFDLRNSHAPFDTFQFPKTDGAFTRLKFNADGSELLLCCEKGKFAVLDAFKGETKTALTTPWEGASKHAVPFEASFSPCGRYIAVGSKHGHVTVWKGRERIAQWDVHQFESSCVQWNPKRVSLLSACHHLAMWCPMGAHSDAEE